MSMKAAVPVHINYPDTESKNLADRLHCAILNGKISDVINLLDIGVSVELENRSSGQTPLFCASYLGNLKIVKLLLRLGADPNRRCSLLCCTPVHAACWSGNIRITSYLLIAGGDLRLHDQKNRCPRDWAAMQQDSERRLATLSLIESFRQMSIRGTDLNSTDFGVDMSTRPHPSFKLPAKLRNTLAALGLVCSENCDYIGPLGNVQGTGFGKLVYGRGESAAALWPVPLVNESEIVDPEEDECGMEAALYGLLPRGIVYRSGATTEMVPRRWHQTPVTIRRMKENQSSDVLIEELHSMSRLRHPGLLLLLGVSATLHWEGIQLIYEPIYQGSLYHRLHIMGSPIPLLKRLQILQQICDAVLFLHSKQLLHCSLTSHAVHLISSGRAKLGCLETLSENESSSRKVYRRVPSSHWDWCMPWLSPECARGEPTSILSDVYSFCCLVWETCSETLPWSPMTSKEINQMWLKRSHRALKLLPSIPQHVGTFLRLGLQPELGDRQEIDLQEIYLMLRLQAAALAHSQQKQEQDSGKPVPQSNVGVQHSWNTVKKRMKQSKTAHFQPDEIENEEEQTAEHEGEEDREEEEREEEEEEGEEEESVPVTCEPISVDLEQLEADEQVSRVSRTTPPIPPTPSYMFSTPPYSGEFIRKKYHNDYEFAIKPASHTTERHSSTCLMSQGRVDSRSAFHISNPAEEIFKTPHTYSVFSSEMRHAVAQPSKLHQQLDDFELWRTKIDDNQNVEMTAEVGQPSFSSTPRNNGNSRPNDTFMACSSTLEETGVKPKRALNFAPLDNPSQPPGFFSRNKPSKEFVASLTAIFNSRQVNRNPLPTSDLTAIGNTLSQDDFTSRGVQCKV